MPSTLYEYLNLKCKQDTEKSDMSNFIIVKH